ncbi:MAG: MerR family DNA-binding transcriptional regulator [Planctomycetota bacterium]
MRNVLSPKEVALAIGVSESSLKRWADAGRIRVRRTAGGHRRIAIQEAIRFARYYGFPVVRPDILYLP